MKYFISLLCLLFAAATTYSSPEEELVYVGDVGIPKEENESEKLTRSGVSLKSQLWANGTVYYTINETTYTTSDYSYGIGDGYLQTIKDAIAEYNKYTCIKFLPKPENDSSITNWATIDEFKTGCNAQGFGFDNKTKAFKMNLENTGNYCPRGTITHEFGHLLGLSHEHNREDRDYYVEIYWDNIKNTTHFRDQFKKDNEPGTNQNFSTFGLPFNYNSMMLYPTSFEQREKGLKTMASKNNLTNSIGNPDDSFWGKANGITKGDQMLLNKLYNCTGTYPEAPLARNEKNPLCPGKTAAAGSSCKRNARKLV